MASINFTKSTSYDGTNINGGFIYENGPENIGANLLNTAAYGRCFTAVSLQAGKIYEAEFYNWNYSGQTIRIGIGIKNSSSTEQGSVTILKSAITSGTVTSSNPSYNIGAAMCLSFMQSSLSQGVAVPVATSSTQGFKALISQSVSGTKVMNGRVRFKVNSGSSLVCKIFFVTDGTDWEKRAGWTNLISTNDLGLIDPGNPSKKYSDGISSTGVYANIQRFGALDTNAYTFTLGQYQNNVVTDLYNTNEFETPTSTLPFDKKGNLGNYGMVYALYGTNVSAKTVRLTPLQTTSALYVVKENGIWVKKAATTSSPAKITLTNGTSFWFILPGGNYGKVQVQFSTM